MLACLMKTNQPPIFAGRMGLQIACLFAFIINHRSTNSSVGRDDAFCLLDTLHLIIYALIFAAIFITLRSRMLNDRGEEKQAIRWERRMTLVLAALFAAANLLFIPAAIFTPPHQDDLSHAARIAK
jgi:predicted membrane protein